MTKIFNKISQKEKRRTLRKNMPPAERILWLQLRNKQIKKYKFRRQYSINRFIVDFYCPQAKLAIEIDGESHDDQNREAYDQQRQKQIENLGINFLRFSNWQIYENLEGVLEEIVNCLKTSPCPLLGKEGEK